MTDLSESIKFEAAWKTVVIYVQRNGTTDASCKVTEEGAHIIFDNNGTLEHLLNQVKMLSKYL